MSRCTGRTGPSENNTPTIDCSRFLFAQVESLEADHEALAARARAAAEAEKEALAGRVEAQALADRAERSAERRVRELEEEAARLRRQLEMGADAAQARYVCKTYRPTECEVRHGAWDGCVRRT